MSSHHTLPHAVSPYVTRDLSDPHAHRQTHWQHHLTPERHTPHTTIRRRDEGQSSIIHQVQQMNGDVDTRHKTPQRHDTTGRLRSATKLRDPFYISTHAHGASTTTPIRPIVREQRVTPQSIVKLLIKERMQQQAGVMSPAASTMNPSAARNRPSAPSTPSGFSFTPSSPFRFSSQLMRPATVHMDESFAQTVTRGNAGGTMNAVESDLPSSGAVTINHADVIDLLHTLQRIDPHGDHRFIQELATTCKGSFKQMRYGDTSTQQLRSTSASLARTLPRPAAESNQFELSEIENDDDFEIPATQASPVRREQFEEVESRQPGNHLDDDDEIPQTQYTPVRPPPQAQTGPTDSIPSPSFFNPFAQSGGFMIDAVEANGLQQSFDGLNVNEAASAITTGLPVPHAAQLLPPTSSTHPSRDSSASVTPRGILKHASSRTPVPRDADDDDAEMFQLPSECIAHEPAPLPTSSAISSAPAVSTVVAHSDTVSVLPHPVRRRNSLVRFEDEDAPSSPPAPSTATTAAPPPATTTEDRNWLMQDEASPEMVARSIVHPSSPIAAAVKQISPFKSVVDEMTDDTAYDQPPIISRAHSASHSPQPHDDDTEPTHVRSSSASTLPATPPASQTKFSPTSAQRRAQQRLREAARKTRDDKVAVAMTEQVDPRSKEGEVEQARLTAFERAKEYGKTITPRTPNGTERVEWQLTSEYDHPLDKNHPTSVFVTPAHQADDVAMKSEEQHSSGRRSGSNRRRTSLSSIPFRVEETTPPSAVVVSSRRASGPLPRFGLSPPSISHPSQPTTPFSRSTASSRARTPASTSAKGSRSHTPIPLNTRAAHRHEISTETPPLGQSSRRHEFTTPLTQQTPTSQLILTYKESQEESEAMGFEQWREQEKQQQKQRQQQQHPSPSNALYDVGASPSLAPLSPPTPSRRRPHFGDSESFIGAIPSMSPKAADKRTIVPPVQQQQAPQPHSHQEMHGHEQEVIGGGGDADDTLYETDEDPRYDNHWHHRHQPHERDRDPQHTDQLASYAPPPQQARMKPFQIALLARSKANEARHSVAAQSTHLSNGPSNGAQWKKSKVQSLAASTSTSRSTSRGPSPYHHTPDAGVMHDDDGYHQSTTPNRRRTSLPSGSELRFSPVTNKSPRYAHVHSVVAKIITAPPTRGDARAKALERSREQARLKAEIAAEPVPQPTKRSATIQPLPLTNYKHPPSTIVSPPPPMKKQKIDDARVNTNNASIGSSIPSAPSSSRQSGGMTPEAAARRRSHTPSRIPIYSPTGKR